MKTKIIKKGKGHEIYKDGKLIMWVIGSIKNAENEIKKL